jgi:RNA polymerase sigma factor (sigma-70 family)
MYTTPPSLLARLKEQPNSDAWGDFIRLYAPLIHRWIRNWGLSELDAEDLLQETLKKLVVELPRFTYDPQKKFRNWLKKIVRNLYIDLGRKKRLPIGGNGDTVHEIPDSQSIAEDKMDREYLFARIKHLIDLKFGEMAWNAFRQRIMDGKPAKDVITQPRISPQEVYRLVQKVLKYLREELNGLLD